jgi:hypothetical protein
VEETDGAFSRADSVEETDDAFSRADSVEETDGESVGKIVHANPTIKSSGGHCVV